MMVKKEPSNNSMRGNVTTIGHISGTTNSPTTVNNNGGGSAELMKLIEDLREQNRALSKQNESLTKIIENLTTR